jgi:hypothetical protein
MSRFMQRVARLLAAPSTAIRTPDPDNMSLRDWADLPAYHPRCDRLPR